MSCIYYSTYIKLVGQSVIHSSIHTKSLPVIHAQLLDWPGSWHRWRTCWCGAVPSPPPSRPPATLSTCNIDKSLGKTTKKLLIRPLSLNFFFSFKKSYFGQALTSPPFPFFASVLILEAKLLYVLVYSSLIQSGV